LQQTAVELCKMVDAWHWYYYIIIILCLCNFWISYFCVVMSILLVQKFTYYFALLFHSLEIGWEEHVQNDIFCVEWDVKP